MKLKLLRNELIESDWNAQAYTRPILRFLPREYTKKFSHITREGFYMGSVENHKYDIYNATLKKL